MFEDSSVDSKKSTARKTSTVVVSTAAHALLIGVFLVAPLLVTAALPSAGVPGTIMIVPGSGMSAPAAAAAAPPPLGGSTSSSSAPLTHEAAPSRTVMERVEPETTSVLDTSTVQMTALIVPTDVPQSLARLGGAGEEGGMAHGLVGGKIGGLIGGVADGLVGGLIGGKIGGVVGGSRDGFGFGVGPGGNGSGAPWGQPVAPPTPRVAEQPVAAILTSVLAAPPVPAFLPAAESMPAPPPPPPAAPIVLRIANYSKANLIYGPPPPYPDLARRAGVVGTVILSARINKQGNIESLTVESGHTLLREGAVKAVQQWRFRPMLLNGDAVEVETRIEITFVIG